jgi:parvulin-like peptidyl-prolyl isomerase
VNLRVIVVDTESKALEALKRLKKGEKFSRVSRPAGSEGTVVKKRRPTH